MQYLITLKNINDTIDNFIYDTETNTLKYKNNILNIGNKRERRIKITISTGFKCNQCCTYCKYPNGNIINHFLNYNSKLTDKLLQLYKNENVYLIDFIGGEPLLYKKEIMDIINKLYNKINNGNYTKFNIATNGILLDNEIINYIIDHGITNVISHDGYGNFLRKHDPLKNELVINFIRKYNKIKKHNVTFNAVMTKYMNNHFEYINYLKNILKIDPIICTCGPMVISNEKQLDYTISDLEQYSNTLYENLLNGLTNNWQIGNKLSDSFIRNLSNTDISFCNFDRNCCVNLEGDIFICQSFSKDDVDKYGNSGKIGNIFDIDKLDDLPKYNDSGIKDYTNTHCKDCIVRFLCGSGCLRIPKEFEEINCKYLYSHYLPLFKYSINKITNFIGKVIDITPL